MFILLNRKQGINHMSFGINVAKSKAHLQNLIILCIALFVLSNSLIKWPVFTKWDISIEWSCSLQKMIISLWYVNFLTYCTFPLPLVFAWPNDLIGLKLVVYHKISRELVIPFYTWKFVLQGCWKYCIPRLELGLIYPKSKI